MGRILVIIPRGDFASEGGIPLVAQMREISGKLVLLLLGHLRKLGLYLFQTHRQTVASRA